MEMDAEEVAALEAEIEACIAEMRMDEDEEEEEEEEERRTAESRSIGKKMKTEKAARVKKKKKVAAEASRKEIDLAAAAVYRAEAEEARRNGQPTEENAALNKWIATGDVEARRCQSRWIAEEVDARGRLEEDEACSSDPSVVYAQRYRDLWNHLWAGADARGSYEDTTPIAAMRYTDKKPNPTTAHPTETMQVYSVKVAEVKEELHWPLEVYGVVAARDVLDHNRNIIFHRDRDNCQTIHEENPYLILTGPTHAVVLFDPVCLEVALRVKGTTESEDKDLSFLVAWCMRSGMIKSCVTELVEASKLSTVELTLGHIVRSVEATISVRVIAGKWPDGFRGVFTANTTSLDSIKVPLLASRDDKLPVATDGTIRLSRRVVCVELGGELRISVMAQCDDEGQAVERDSKAFKPKEASRSYDMLQVSSCKMEVTIAWSLPSAGLY